MQPGTPPPQNTVQDHLLIPTSTQAAYAQKRVAGMGISKIRLGSLR